MDRKKAVPLKEDAMNEDLLNLDIDTLPAKGEIPQSIEQKSRKKKPRARMTPIRKATRPFPTTRKNG